MDSTLSYLETLRRISAGMDPSRGFHAGLKYLLGILAQNELFIRPHLVIFDPEARMLRLYLSETAPRTSQVVYTPGMGITGQVFSTGCPVIVERILGHPVFLCKFFERTDEEMSRLSFISVPVLTPLRENEGRDQQVLGVLSMDTPCSSREELDVRCRFLETVAAIIATQAAYAQQEVIRQYQTAEYEENARPFIAVSKAMRHVTDLAARAASASMPVLLVGESGTGREYLASSIHAAGPHHDLPMQRYECEGQSEEMAERMLFGYRKGAFPGALQTRKGFLELARSSTLFLGQIENLPPGVQDTLARALQEQKFFRVGGGQSIELATRLICSANTPLENLVEEGRFSQKLYSRLASCSITLPPLREHAEDILPLARLFLKGHANSLGKRVEHLSVPVQDLLLHYAWPGNIRELKACIEQAVQSCDETTLQVRNLPAALHSTPEPRSPGLSFNDSVARFEQELLADALRKTQGNMLQAARDLRASYRIINYKVKKYGIDPRKFVTRN